MIEHDEMKSLVLEHDYTLFLDVTVHYFRLLLIGYFEGLDAERGIAWRANDSLAVRSFLRLSLDEAAPDHSTISRTRRLIDLETHRAVFTWVQVRLVEPGLLKGKTDAIDATMLRGECGAAQYRETRHRGELSGVLDRARAGLGHRYADARGAGSSGPKRKKKTSNTDWRHPGDPEAKVAKIKDGRTHLARPSRS
jgi:transposase-like protein DUF772